MRCAQQHSTTSQGSLSTNKEPSLRPKPITFAIVRPPTPKPRIVISAEADHVFGEQRSGEIRFSLHHCLPANTALLPLPVLLPGRKRPGAPSIAHFAMSGM